MVGTGCLFGSVMHRLQTSVAITTNGRKVASEEEEAEEGRVVVAHPSRHFTISRTAEILLSTIHVVRHLLGSTSSWMLEMLTGTRKYPLLLMNCKDSDRPHRLPPLVEFVGQPKRLRESEEEKLWWKVPWKRIRRESRGGVPAEAATCICETSAADSDEDKNAAFPHSIITKPKMMRSKRHREEEQVMD